MGKTVLAIEQVEERILSVRGQKVVLDSDLAELYGVETKVLIQAVKRNKRRFPEDFMFVLNAQESREATALRSQFVTSKPGRGGRRTLPYAFTEQGVAMLSSVLNSDRAIEVNIAIMRAFVRMRSILAEHKALWKKLDELDRKYARHDSELKVIFNTLRQLMEPPKLPGRRRIGF